MAKIEWSDKLSVGVEQIDNQHKELLRIANVLINAVSLGREVRVLENVLKRLREYTVFHFNSEEELMGDIRYPGRGDQAVEHARLKKEVKDYQRQIYKKEGLTPDEVLEFIKDWLLKHILTYDRELARFIHEQETSAKPVDIDESEDK